MQTRFDAVLLSGSFPVEFLLGWEAPELENRRNFILWRNQVRNAKHTPEVRRKVEESMLSGSRGWCHIPGTTLIEPDEGMRQRVLGWPKDPRRGRCPDPTLQELMGHALLVEGMPMGMLSAPIHKEGGRWILGKVLSWPEGTPPSSQLSFTGARPLSEDAKRHIHDLVEPAALHLDAIEWLETADGQAAAARIDAHHKAAARQVTAAARRSAMRRRW